MFLKIATLLVSLSTVQAQMSNVAFIKLGTYEYGAYRKTYYTSRYFESPWVQTRAVCKSYGMDIVSLETKREQDAFLGICQANSHSIFWNTHVGGMALSGGNANSWYWVATGKHIDYPLSFKLGEPNNLKDNERCLSLLKLDSNNFGFNDLDCNYATKFFCQLKEYNDEYEMFEI